MSKYLSWHILLILLAIPVVSYCQENEPSYYNNQLSAIVSDFSSDYFDDNSISDLISRASSVIDEIEDELENSNLSSSQKAEYKSALGFAKDVKNGIGCGSGTNYMCDDKASFYRGAALLGLSYVSVNAGKYCIDIIKIEYRELVCYLAVNNTGVDRVQCKWSANKGMDTGSMEMGIFSNGARNIYSNRGNPELKTIYFTSVTCN